MSIAGAQCPAFDAKSCPVLAVSLLVTCGLTDALTSQVLRGAALCAWLFLMPSLISFALQLASRRAVRLVCLGVGLLFLLPHLHPGAKAVCESAWALVGGTAPVGRPQELAALPWVFAAERGLQKRNDPFQGSSGVQWARTRLGTASLALFALAGPALGVGVAALRPASAATARSPAPVKTRPAFPWGRDTPAELAREARLSLLHRAPARRGEPGEDAARR